MSNIFTFDDNNIPTNTLFGDTYYSKLGGLEETKKVFIDACELNHKIKAQKNLVIGETGFGTGLNFLATLKEFEENAPDGTVLQFFTFEKYLMPAETAARAHANFDTITQLSKLLISKWPPNVLGLHSIEIKERVFLNIFIGDANETMKMCDFKADAWFLDGFAPSKNPDFWTDTIFNQIRRLVKPDGILATYSVAAMVRDGLIKAGFEFEKREGFANKKHRLIARPKDSTQMISRFKPPKTINVIGGGIAGLSIAYYAKKFGMSPIVYDNDLNGEIKASNNPRGICMPRLDRLDNKESKFFKTAYIHALNFYRNLGYGIENVKIKEPAKNQRDLEKFTMFNECAPLPKEFVEIHDGFLIHNGALIEPPKVCETLRKGVEIRQQSIKNIKQVGGIWYLYDKDGNEIGQSEALIVAAGAQIKDLLGHELPLSGREGVVSIADMIWPENEVPIASGGYAIPFGDKTLFGATFERVDLNTIPSIRADSHEKNLSTISKFAPELAENLKTSKIEGRASMRVVSKDKLPIAGSMTNGLYCLGALGSRGFSLAPFLSQMIITKIMTGNLMVEKSIAEITDPLRFGNQFSNI